MDITKKARNRPMKGMVILLAAALIIGYYIYLLHTGQAQELLKSIQNLGFLGIIVGILVQTFANIVPVPGEFISVILMEIYGPIWGGIYTWIGGLAGAIGALYLTKWFAKPFFGKLAQPFLVKVESFIQKHQTIGLLFIRLVPLVPYHFVNYAIGFLNVSIWRFIWTTGIGILPFTIAMSGIYAGVRQGSLIWGVVGGGLFVLLLILGLILRKRHALRTITMQ
ncbi:TVP38/TMEM64 family protein [Paenibacillus sp. N3.4]|uniref:TVP38/TMEM64 family protein n=1 Tax=Paenibacillus sp. N3.4 TaxID=2603222 RepID=UPI0011C83B69|nr:VTT domain-containing protein [Paenibacillus sp. N3.4]TXK76974.1 TVP38/TMEM64 family protein [Paenibacillus sp. N3.4]